MADFLTRWDTELELLDSDKKQLLDEIVKKFEEDPTNVDFCCRQIKACLVVADSYEKIKSKYDAKKYTEEALKHAKMGLILNSDSMEVHKWYCAAVGRMAPYVSTKERIKFGHEFKEHRDIAVSMDDNDHLMHHMYGRWCYEVASLTYLERKIAETFFATLPKSTFEDALESLQKADKLKHVWKANHLWLAKVYIAMKNYAEAIKWIDSGLSIDSLTEEDAVSQIELKDLEKTYAKYRQK